MNIILALAQSGQPGWLDEFLSALHKNLIVGDRWMQYLNGLSITLRISFFSLLFGTIIGVIVCFMRLSRFKVVRGIAITYIDILRGTPSMVQLMIIFYVILSPMRINREISAIVAFAINSSAYISELFRAGILAVDHGQTEAGRSLGMSGFKTSFFVVVPQAIKNCFPSYINEVSTLIKETAIVGYIAINDITKIADTIRSRTYEAFFPLIITAIIYYIIVKTVASLLSVLERRMRKSDKR